MEVEPLNNGTPSLSAASQEGRDAVQERAGRREARALSLGIELHAAASAGDADRIAVLARYGANVEARLPDGRRPLHTAAQAGRSAAVKALLEAGADPNIRVPHAMSWTPLHMAAVSGNPASIKTLLGAGVGTEAKDDLGRSAFDLLPESVTQSVREACNPNAEASRNDSQERTPAMDDVRLRKGDHVRQTDGSWRRVVSVDGHGAWLEGNIVTAHAVRRDWHMENVRTERQMERDGSRNPPAPEREEAPGQDREGETAMNEVSETADRNTGTLGREERIRQRHRTDRLLQLTCMASERIAPDQRESWGDLGKRIGDLLDVVEKAKDVPEEAVEAQARRTARKRAEADVWVGAAREAGGGLLHQTRARYVGSAEFCSQDQMARNAEALAKGLEGLTPDVLRPNNLERTVAKAVIATKGTPDAEVARALETGLRYGWVQAATRIRHDRMQLVDNLSRQTEPLEKRDRMRLASDVYARFQESEIRDICSGKGPHVGAVKSADARDCLIKNVRDLHAEPTALPAPWREIHAGISRAVNPAPERAQPDRSRAAERHVISASM